MLTTRMLAVGLVALAASAGCTTGPRAFVAESTMPAAAVGGTNPGQGFGRPYPSASEIPDCRGSGFYNRATGLCVSPGGP